MSQHQPPVEDGPIPFFGAGTAGGPPLRNGPPPMRQQQRPPFAGQQQQHFQGHNQTTNQPGRHPAQPQRHPQQHPPHFQQDQQQQQYSFQRQQQQQQQQQQPSRQMNQSPFAPAADLFASPPVSNLQNQAPLQGYQPQGGFPLQGHTQGHQQTPPKPASQSTQHQAPPPKPNAPLLRPIQQNIPQRNPQHHQGFPPQQHQNAPTPTPVQDPVQAAPAVVPTQQPAREQTNSPFGNASDLFGSANQSVSGWSIPSEVTQPSAPAAPFAPTAPVAKAPPKIAQATPFASSAPAPAPVPVQTQVPPPQAAPAQAPFSAGRPPLPPVPLQKQPSLTQVPQTLTQQTQNPLPPPPQRQPSFQQQPPQQQQQSASRQGSLSAQGPPPQGPPRNSPGAPGPHGPLTPQPLQAQSNPERTSTLPPLPSASIGSNETPRHGPLTGPPSTSSVHQHGAGASPYANHPPPKTPLLTAIQTPLMLPAQTTQAYQSSRTPFMGPLRPQFPSTSQLLLEPCPFAECGGENKPQAKFCSECGRSISAASRSATPALGHYAEFPGSNAPPMPSLDRMNSFSFDQQPHQEQQPETYAGYSQEDQSYQQEYSQDQQYDYDGQQEQYDYNGVQQGYDQGYDQTGYYDENGQYYDPTTGQYIDNYAQQEVMPEPEPEPVEPEPVGIDDPLNRAFGCPLIAFGFGGKIMSSFPRTVQRFASATSGMVNKRYPGDLQLQHIKDLVLVDRAIATYPGPLLMDSSVQMKNKRKDVLKLIEDKIKELEVDLHDSTFDAHKVFIWKIFKVMFEQEGALIGGAKVDEAVRSVLLSIPLSVYPVQPVQQPSSPIGSSASLDVLQDLLRNGDRAGAVHYAMSTNLWAHALVISSCVNKELWKEAVNGFVNQELMDGSGDLQANGREALRVLYALFSGQTQTAVSELIPLNLRKAPEPHPESSQGAVEDQFVTAESLSMMKPIEEPAVPAASLGQWRDTLVMILSNRTADDQTAISALGDMLMKEGWVEAAHICYLLSPRTSVHSGPDAQLNKLVLIGADSNPHTVYPYYKNIEAFQKTEIYEFASALRSAGATGGLPFLQSYKLIYVWTLIEWGMFSEAGRYLESIEAIVKSQTKGSPYYNVTFLERLKEVTDRLTGSNQLAVSGDSWFTKKVPKPTIGGIFDALDSKISKFIAGDNDQPKQSVTEPKVESGPFSNAPALPDIIPAPVRTASSASTRAVAAAPVGGNNSRRSSVLGRSSLEIPRTDVYGHSQPAEHALASAAPIDASADQYRANADYTYADDSTYNAEYQTQEYQTQDYQQGETEYSEGQYDAAYDNQYQTAEGAEYNYTEDAAYNAEYQAQGDAQYEATQYDATQYDDTQYDPTRYETTQYDASQYDATQYDATQYGDNQYTENAFTGNDYGAEYHEQTAEVAEVAAAEYSDVGYQNMDDQSTDAYSQPSSAVAVAPVQETAPPKQNEVLVDEPTFEQRADLTSLAKNIAKPAAPEIAPVVAVAPAQSLVTEAQPVVEQNVVQGEYTEDNYDYQSEYQQGDYQQGEYQQGEYAQEGYDQSQYPQENYQEGDYQQTDYQEGQYQDGQYQQEDYSQGQYQGEYQEGDYQQQGEQQAEYAQGDYQQEGEYQVGAEYSQADYNQPDYQPGEYQHQDEYQGEYQQGEYQGDYNQGEYAFTGNYEQRAAQDSTEPGVLPVTSEYQDQAEYDAAGVYQGHPNGAEYSAQGVQDSSSGSWWGADANANGTEQTLVDDSVATPADGAQEPQDSYEEGQFISFGAVPTIPSFGTQISTPVNNSHAQQNNSAFDDEDDFGMGNNSLKKGKAPAPAEDADAPATQDAASANAAGEGDDSKGWWSKLLGGEKREGTPKPVKANLGEENNFYFDETLKKWVNKKAGPEAASTSDPLPPPPTSRTATPGTSNTPPAGGPPSRGPPSGGMAAAAGAGPTTAGPPGPRPGAGAGPRRGARAKYVDVFNTTN
ncbi:vesicle coat component [Podila clonocystis]|nr:vesicle coat component [Podila clonocystis]